MLIIWGTNIIQDYWHDNNSKNKHKNDTKSHQQSKLLSYLNICKSQRAESHRSGKTGEK